MEIVSSTSNFDFKSTTLADPQPLTGQAGFYFTQLGVGPENKSLCLQLPECVTKQGVVNVKNAKYLDLMFERDKHDELMKWVEKLEYTCQDIIDTKKELWFQTELTRDDIETMMAQVTRLYQSGKYVLMRVFIELNKIGQKCIAYDEKEIGFDLDTLEGNKTIIPLVMIEGVKFSSRSFEISIKLVQVMIMGRDDKNSSCLIKRPITVTPAAPEPILEKPIVNNKIGKEQASLRPSIVKPVTAKPIAQPIAQPIAAVAKPVAAVAKPVAAPLVKSIVAPLSNKEKTLINKPIIREKTAVDTIDKTSLGEKVLKPIIRNTTFGNTTVGNNTVGIIKNVNTAIKPANSVPANSVPVTNLVKKNDIEEITINYQDLSDTISLKNPNEVYYEIYKNAREKAKECRMKAVEAYLEAKQIKTKYMLQDLDDSDDDSEEDDIEYENGEE